MGNYFDRQPSSRIINNQNLLYVGSVVQSAAFGPETFQIRVISQIAGFFLIDNSTTLSSVGTNGNTLPLSTVGGEYFTTSPGQNFQFGSTSTSSGVVSVSEMS